MFAASFSPRYVGVAVDERVVRIFPHVVRVHQSETRRSAAGIDDRGLRRGSRPRRGPDRQTPEQAVSAFHLVMEAEVPGEHGGVDLRAPDHH